MENLIYEWSLESIISILHKVAVFLRGTHRACLFFLFLFFFFFFFWVNPGQEALVLLIDEINYKESLK